LIVASRRLARARSGCGSAQAIRTGRRARVYFDADPALWAASRRARELVMPV
jgi:hypothetical protein